MNRATESPGARPEASAGSSTGAARHYLQLLELQPGTVINGHYLLERPLGQGGFGAVFAARDTVLNSPVALKFLDPSHTADERKFLRVQREITIARRITDPHLVKIFSLEEWHGVHFFVMELVSGTSLADCIRSRERLAWSEFQPLFLQILEGIAVLHRHGIVHRDLKPSNIMIDGQEQVKVLDFGLSKEIGDVEKTSSIGEIVGTPLYITPEQVQGQPLDGRSDIYQLGLLLYIAISGVHPFHGSDSTLEIIVSHLKKKPGKIVLPGERLPRFLTFGLDKALEKDPSRRFQTIAEMIAFFRRGRISWLKRAGRVLTRHAFLYALGGLAAALLVIAGWLATVGSPAMHHADFSGSVLRAKNRAGRTLWEKDFKPFSVLLAQVTGNTHDQVFDFPKARVSAKANSAERYVWAFLNNPRSLVLAAATSIAGDELDNRWVVLDSTGRTMRDNPLGQTVGQTYDFARVFKMADFQFIRKDPAQETEAWFNIHQGHGYYPSAFVFLQGVGIHQYSNPGQFHNFWRLPAEPEQARFLLLGSNNLLGHLFYVAEVAFDTRQANESIVGVPNLQPNPFNNMAGFLVFLPHTCRETANHWASAGTLEFVDNKSGAGITVSRDYEIRINRDGETRTFRDDPLVLSRVYAAVNSGYQERVNAKNPEKALTIVRQANREKVANPFLKSAILCIQGSLEVETGDFAAARKSLRESLTLFPDQRDAPQKLCEIEFLKGNPDRAMQLLEGQFENSASFWGLAEVGNLLFKGYCGLQAGDFSRAEEQFQKILRTISCRNDGLYGMLNLFRGDYGAACDLFKRDDTSVFQVFEQAEYRLLYGRALLLDGRDPEKARFFFRDLMQNSITHGHLAEMSNTWFLARDEKIDQARRTALPLMARLVRKARGDFFTRFWLFYDAFLYGEIMGMAGDRAEARRGYELCIQANPHTGLARQAQEKLRHLSGA
jgi:tetratricopeptide (TPR) repeat protein